jgi:uncharacterized protein YjbI with pentapeptide repeats
VSRKPASAQPPDAPDIPAELESTALDERTLEDGATWAGVRVVDARLQSVRFEGCDLTGADFSDARFERCEVRGCMLDRIRGPASLRGVAMPWSDVVTAAATFADALGIEILDE